MEFIQTFCTLKVVMDCMQPLQLEVQSGELSVLEIELLIEELVEILEGAIKRDLLVCLVDCTMSGGKGIIALKHFTERQKQNTRLYATRYIKRHH
jgi:hypothetical protein